MRRVQLQGLGVSSGIAIGPVLRMVREVPEPDRDAPPTSDQASEQTRALDALDAVAVDLEARGELVGGEAQEVLEAQAMMARDPAIADGTARAISEGRTAARAIFEAFAPYRDLIAGSGTYIAARVADVDDVRDRAVALLLGMSLPGAPMSTVPYILVARDLSPADTANLDPSITLGLITEEGGPTSHTAILARTMGVAAIVACAGATDLVDGTTVILNGDTGVVNTDPGGSDIDAARGAMAARATALAAVTGPGATADGHRVPLLANVGRPHDVESAVRNGAEGVGLYRTEFLFLDRQSAPSQEEQIAAYAAVLSAFPGGKVVVRVLDAGADKPIGFLPGDADEPNPALGVRGLRMLQRHPEILASQLRALVLASTAGPAQLEVMAPMVSDAGEARWFVAACREAGLDGSIGVMVEVPAAALQAASIAAEVGFFSIGTNDLTQYTFAADREVASLSHLQNAWQPAILELVALTAAAAESVGRLPPILRSPAFWSALGSAASRWHQPR
jgi:phosphotransferase system enzyme I (PtsI)